MTQRLIICFSDISPIRYRQIRIENDEFICFRDDVYLCICEGNLSRVECFIYDDRLDQCSNYLSGGRCLRGDHRQSNDFLWSSMAIQLLILLLQNKEQVY